MRVFLLIVNIFSFIVKSTLFLPKFFNLRHKGIKSFESQLLQLGIETAVIKELKETYKEVMFCFT